MVGPESQKLHLLLIFLINLSVNLSTALLSGSGIFASGFQSIKIQLWSVMCKIVHQLYGPDQNL